MNLMPMDEFCKDLRLNEFWTCKCDRHSRKAGMNDCASMNDGSSSYSYLPSIYNF